MVFTKYLVECGIFGLFLGFLSFDRKFELSPVQSIEVPERQDDMNLIFHKVLCLYQYEFITHKLVIDPKLLVLLAGKYLGCNCFSRKLREKSPGVDHVIG